STPPGTHQTQLLAILFEDRVIAHPGPLPATACGLAFAGSRAPQRDQHLQAQASEPLDPGALGHRTEQTYGEVFIPAPYTTQFGVGAAAKEGRTHHSNDLAQQFVLTP